MTLPRLRARALVALLVLALAALAGCDPRSDPITPRGIAWQQNSDGELRANLGIPCRDVTSIRLTFLRTEDDPDPLVQELTSTDPAGVPSLDTFVVGEPVPGMTSETPAPDDGWTDFYAIRVLLKTARGQAAVYLLPDSYAEDADDHPGEYFVQDQGWFPKKTFASSSRFKPLCASINP